MLTGLKRMMAKAWGLCRISHVLDRQPTSSWLGSQAYWEERYKRGDDSGAGSHGRSARLKAQVINAFVIAHDVKSVIEFGCGDGHQLALAEYPQYMGFDVSEAAIQRCRQLFWNDRAKRFGLLSEYRGEKADLALSLDVIYHLVEDDVFSAHMAAVFRASNRYVVIYSSNENRNPWFLGKHLRHRKFTMWISENAPDWRLLHTRSGFAADFHFYEWSPAADVLTETPRADVGADT